MYTLPISVDQLVGSTLGKYRVEQLLGHGNINAVYMARHQETNQTVMLTAFIIPQDFPVQAREYFRQRFVQEATALTKLSHPNVLPVYEFGEQFGYPYLITPLITSGSVAKLLKQQGRLTPEQTLSILKQVASGLDYAHSHGVVHGSLKPVNFILNDAQKVQIAGFGLIRILEMRGTGQSSLPYAHLLNVAGTFLGTPEYVAPEVVLGSPLDARADIYALGITLFEMLSGKPPFTGGNHLEIARMHVLQSMPSLHALCPDLPAALDLVIQRAVEREPAQRVESAEKLTIAFQRVIQVISHATGLQPAVQPMQDRDVTLPPTVNWFDGAEFSESGKWQTPNGSGTGSTGKSGSASDASSALWQYAPDTASQLAAAPDGDGKSVDPFVWWSTSVLNRVQPSTPGATGTGDAGTFNPTTSRLSATSPLIPKRPVDKRRRRTIALLATGGVVAAGVLGVGGISLAHMLQQSHAPSQASTTNTMQATQATSTKANPTPTATPTQQPTPTAKPTQKPTQKAVTQPTAKPTPTPAPPTPTPTPKPGHTGTVIGSTSMSNNTAQTTNGIILLRQSNGNFVAYRNSCPHEGVSVKYNGSQFQCTRHSDAFFNPSNGVAVSGPPSGKSLSHVTIMVNGDGTITM
jgi:serine/threonine protein kinase